MSPRVPMGLIIRYASHNFRFIMFNPTQRTSKSAPKFLPESQDENVCQPLCIDSQGHGTRKLITKTYIKWINRTSHCHHGYPIARHTSSVLKSLKTQSDKKTSKGKLNSSQEDRGGNHHRRPSSSSWRSPWRAGSSSPSGLRVCTNSYVFDLSLSCSWDDTILIYRELY